MKTISQMRRLKVAKIFKNKGRQEIFNEKEKFIQLLSILNDDQQNLMIQLLDRFTLINTNNLLIENIQSLFNGTILNERKDLGNNFCIYPLKKYGESGNGSDTIIRSLDLIIKAKKLNGFKISVCKKIEDFKYCKGRKIVLIDDYIGTGNTVKASMANFIDNFKKINDNIPINQNDLCIFALTAQEQGIQELNNSGIDVCAGSVFRKGISDFYTGKEKDNMIAVMKSIEEIMNGENKLKVDCFFGYGQSEGLISFARCPNNTFPVFWFNQKYKNGVPWTATFIR